MLSVQGGGNVKRVLVHYRDATFSDIHDLIYSFGGYFDADRRCAVFPFDEELIEELENRGIRFKVEVS